MTQAAAQAAITAAGLTNGAVTNANSATVPAGSVISQNPVGGASVAPGSAVALVVSLGPALVTVPNVVNQTQAAAQAAITAAGLTNGAVTTREQRDGGGRIGHQPEPGGRRRASRPAARSRWSSRSVRPSVNVTVPNVVEPDAGGGAVGDHGAGLTNGAVTNANSATVPAGSVISQNPAAGASVAPGSAVALVVSLGPAAAEPDAQVDASFVRRHRRTHDAGVQHDDGRATCWWRWSDRMARRRAPTTRTSPCRARA